MLTSSLLALVVVLGAVGSVTWITDRFVPIERGWLDKSLKLTVGVITGIGGWFMLPVLTVLISSLFQETINQRVERAYYPDAADHEVLKFCPDSCKCMDGACVSSHPHSRTSTGTKQRKETPT
jgi:hypothetical protein